MYFAESSVYDPYYNLALEEYLFTNLPKGSSCFMLWQNDRTVVIGNYQNAVEEIDTAYVKEHGIRVARRLSGGGAVYHDLQNLNYTFITDDEDIETVTFEKFVVPLVNVLRDLGLDASHTGRNDVTVGGKKICGNSQKIAHGRVLHHGCIMLGTDLSRVAGALKPKKGKIESRSTKSVRSPVTTINACLEEPLSMEQFKQLLIDEVSKTTELQPYVFPEEADETINWLREQKYATWDWNYGKAPAYDMQREKKYPDGFVSVRMKVKEGVIEEIRFYGDFFANREMTELEEVLAGKRLDESFRGVLEEYNAGSYIKGVSSDQLYELIMME